MAVDGRVALITGATGALGSVVSRRFLEAGARLVLCDLETHKMEEMSREAGPERCISGRVDVTHADQVADVVRRGGETRRPMP